MSTLKKNENGNTYHHGDLRNTLVQLGTEMLISSGEASLSLRKLAQQAGVSHNAPYQHFADKQALLAAIAEEGFKLLADFIEVALLPEANSSPQQRLMVAARAYVRFALAHPSQLQLMFGTFPTLDYPSLSEQSLRTLGKLIAVVEEVQNAGLLKPSVPQEAAVVVWMLVHGLSTVLITGKMPLSIQQNRSADELAERFIQMICVGLVRDSA